MLLVSHTSKSREKLNESKCLKESEMTCVYSDLIIINKNLRAREPTGSEEKQKPAVLRATDRSR